MQADCAVDQAPLTDGFLDRAFRPTARAFSKKKGTQRLPTKKNSSILRAVSNPEREMTFPWLLVLAVIGWTFVGMIVALIFGRFLRGAAHPLSSSAEPSWAMARLDD